MRPGRLAVTTRDRPGAAGRLHGRARREPARRRVRRPARHTSPSAPSATPSTQPSQHPRPNRHRPQRCRRREADAAAVRKALVAARRPGQALGRRLTAPADQRRGLPRHAQCGRPADLPRDGPAQPDPGRRRAGQRRNASSSLPCRASTRPGCGPPGRPTPGPAVSTPTRTTTTWCTASPSPTDGPRCRRDPARPGRAGLLRPRRRRAGVRAADPRGPHAVGWSPR